MKHGSLFSGIGGFDLAAEWMGWENVFHCELDDFPRKVLHHYWPNAISYEDIRETDFFIHRGQIDILTGGFPCQPYSQAGKRLGKEDERHLWPEMLRAIREIKPRWIVGENVLGLVNWSDGLVFEEVQTDLETEGYQVQTFVLPAAGVNAPHQRYRVWFVAHSDQCRYSAGREEETKTNGIPGKCRPKMDTWNFNGTDISRPTSDTEGIRINRAPQHENSYRQSGERWRCNNDDFGTVSFTDWENFPTQSPIRIRNDGISGKLDGITFSKWRTESIKAYGNAVVPQVVLQIFKSIEQYENLTK